MILSIGCATIQDVYLQDPLTDVRPIHFYDWAGNVTDHLQFIVNDTSITYTAVPGVSGTDWTITPDLPEGITFSKSTCVLTSNYQREFKSQQFTIQVSKEGTVVAQSTFSLEVVLCSSGIIYRVEQVHGTCGIEIRQDSVVLRNVTTKGGLRMCLPPGVFDAYLSCVPKGFEDCTLRLTDPQDLVLFRTDLEQSHSELITVDPQPKEAPSFGEFKKDFYAVYKGLDSFLIPIVGAYYPVEFYPPLPEKIFWSPLSQSLSVLAERGSYKFTVTVHNAVGKASTNIGVYVDTCPENLYLLAPRCSRTSQDNITVTNSQKEVVMREYMNGAIEANTCVPAGDYDVTITMLDSKYASDYILSFMEENGDYTESFIRNRGLATDVHRITLGDAVAFGSSFKFLVASSVDAKWTRRKFNDRKWSEGVAGHWGSFSSSASSAFFRKQFSVKDLSFQSVVQVATKAVGDITLYLNGEYLRRFTSADASRIHTTVPATFLSKGDNVICVEIHGTSSETIVFDLSVHLSRSSLLHRPQSGIASDEPKQESTSYKAQYAFEKPKYGSDHWKSAGIPVNLTYVFTDLHRSWINRIHFYPSYEDQAPVDFEIDGLITTKEGNETVIKEADTLGHIVDPNFGYIHRYYEFDFTPKRIYDGFRFRFLKGYANDSIVMDLISFYMRSSLRCKRTWGYKSALLGESLMGRCPMKMTGYRTMHCVPDAEGKPVWERDDSMCVSRYAPRGFSFVDTKIVASPLADGWLDSLCKQMRTIVTKNLTVWEDQVSFPMNRFLDEAIAQREIMMRFTVEEEIGDYVLKKLKEEMAEVEKQITTTMSSKRSCEVVIDPDPKYRSPFPWSTVWWVLGMIAILAVTNILTFFYALSFRSQTGEKQGLRRLKKGALLEQVM